MTESLSQALLRLSARGFDRHLVAAGGRLRDVATGERYDPELLVIAEVVRFEGESDPDEQAVLFALQAPSGGALGTYTAVYGPAMPADDVRVVERLAAKT